MAKDYIFSNDFDVWFKDKLVEYLADLDKRGINTNTRVNDIITGVEQPSEVVDARGGHSVLGERLNEFTTEIESTKQYNTTVVHQIFVDGTNGSFSNDGTEASPYKSVNDALNHMRKLSSIMVDGTWEIRLKGTFTEGYKIYSLPRFRYPIKFIGEVDELGQPATFFDGTTAVRKIGLWFEPLLDMNVEVHNLDFKNYTNGFNGYGVLGKGGGMISIINCRAENCDVGFAAIRNTVFEFTKCVSINCTTSGYRAQYSASGSFGNEVEGASSVCQAINCPQGFYVTRNAVVHIDFCIADGCDYAGVLVDQNSRAHVLGTTLRNNDYGVRIEGSGEWINNTSDVNVFENNTVNYGHFGVGRETRLYSSRSQNEFRLGSVLDQKVHTGTTSDTAVYALPSTVSIPSNFFSDVGKKIRLRVFGVVSGAGDKTFSFKSVDTSGANLYTIGNLTTSDNFGTFIYEVELYAVNASSQKSTNLITIDGTTPRITYAVRSMNTDIERLLRVYCQLTDPTATVTFEGVEIYMMG